MKDRNAIAHELQELIQRHYYSEDFELVSAVRAFQAGLSIPERDELRAVVLGRLLDEGSMVDILLCSVIDVPSAGPVLAHKLDRESVPSQLTRTLITAVQSYPGDEAFRAVERFVDSDQEGEALAALARLDFNRAWPYLVRAMDREHFHGPLLHMLHERAKLVGVPALALEIKALAQRGPGALPEQLRRVLLAKPAPYNPFMGEDLERLRRALS